MTVKKLFEWLKKYDAKIAFGFKGSVPYISVQCGGSKARIKLGEIGELEEALAGLIASGVRAEGSDAPAQ